MSKASKVDRSFLNGTSCEAPCWYRIIPGESTQSDVYSILQEVPFVDSSSIQEYQTNYAWIESSDIREINFKCFYSQKDPCGGIITGENRVKLIWYRVEYSLTFEDILEKIGEPTHVTCSTEVGEWAGESTSLYWPDEGIVAIANLLKCPIVDGKVKPNTQVDYVDYTVDEYFNHILPDAPDWMGFIE